MSAKVILFAAGDPGGAAALLPVIVTIAARGARPLVLDHGFLGQRADAALERVAEPGSGGQLADVLGTHHVDALCFGTSLTDQMPLAFARAAKSTGRRTVCVLDNWMNYRKRLGIDGGEPLMPDTYAMMDDLALEGAIFDGIPREILNVTGHPGLASLESDRRELGAEQRAALRNKWNVPPDRDVILFVSEPVAKDQGTSPESPGFRGYTETSVLADLCRELQPAADRVALIVAPHPREDPGEVAALWQSCRGKLSGGLVTGVSGRSAVLCADRVSGMASILLYEAWLLGKPVLSLQPGLRRDDLRLIGRRDGVILIDREAEIATGVSTFLRQSETSVRSDLGRHALAAERVTDVLLSD
jgi:hypothetical protein